MFVGSEVEECFLFLVLMKWFGKFDELVVVVVFFLFEDVGFIIG